MNPNSPDNNCKLPAGQPYCKDCLNWTDCYISAGCRSVKDYTPDAAELCAKMEDDFSEYSRLALLDELETKLAKMRPGPYEYWDESGNDIIAAQCHEGDGVPIAALAGIVSMPDEFRAISDLLNAAPDLIRWARRGLGSQNTQAQPPKVG